MVMAEGANRPRSPYSPAIDVGDRVYLAGMTGRGSDAADETRTILSSIRGTLQAASLDVDAVEDIWVYLAEIRDWDAVRAVLEEEMGADMPSATVVGSRLMGRSVVEIQVVARRHQGREDELQRVRRFIRFATAPRACERNTPSRRRCRTT